jgi:hypothetical protein
MATAPGEPAAAAARPPRLARTAVEVSELQAVVARARGRGTAASLLAEVYGAAFRGPAVAPGLARALREVRRAPATGRGTYGAVRLFASDSGEWFALKTNHVAGSDEDVCGNAMMLLAEVAVSVAAAAYDTSGSFARLCAEAVHFVAEDMPRSAASRCAAQLGSDAARRHFAATHSRRYDDIAVLRAASADRPAHCGMRCSVVYAGLSPLDGWATVAEAFTGGAGELATAALARALGVDARAVVAAVVAQTAAVVAVLWHDCGFVHGDLSAANVFVRLEAGAVALKLVDTGWSTARLDTRAGRGELRAQAASRAFGDMRERTVLLGDRPAAWAAAHARPAGGGKDGGIYCLGHAVGGTDARCAEFVADTEMMRFCAFLSHGHERLCAAARAALGGELSAAHDAAFGRALRAEVARFEGRAADDRSEAARAYAELCSYELCFTKAAACVARDPAAMGRVQAAAPGHFARGATAWAAGGMGAPAEQRWPRLQPRWIVEAVQPHALPGSPLAALRVTPQ